MKSLRLNSTIRTFGELALDYNKLEQIDLNGLKALTQLSLANNLLSTIDLKPVGRNITALNLTANKFTFATLPVQSKYPKLLVYFYGSRGPIEPVISEDFMSFDLSSQAVISENNTTYRWFSDKQFMTLNQARFPAKS